MICYQKIAYLLLAFLLALWKKEKKKKNPQLELSKK